MESNDNLLASGVFEFVLCDKHGREIGRRDFRNTVTVQGKTFLVEKFFRSSGYNSQFWLGLISLDSFSAISASDSAVSHPGWLEAGTANAPTYSGSRKTLTWSAASGGSTTGVSQTFTFSGAGTVRGGFIATASAVDGAGGVLYSAGLFTGGNLVVALGNVLTATYTATVS